MKKQKGSAGLIALTLFGIILALGVAVITSYVSAANYGASAETQLLAKYENNKNILGQYTIKIGEMAQVPEIARDDLRTILEATFEGRYGEGGVDRGSDPNQKTFQWLQEQNPGLTSPELYTRLQQTMEAGRNEFAVNQTEMLDLKRAYETNLKFVWRGFWLKTAGYPKIDLTKINIVVAGNTQQVFESGVDSGVSLRPKAE